MIGIDYIADSCVLFDLFKNRNDMVNRLRKYEVSKVAISPVTILEIMKHQDKVLAREQAYRARKLFRKVQPFPEVWSEAARSLKDWPGGKDELPDIPDLIIGHTARLIGAKVLTMNVFDFQHIKGLEVINPLEDNHPPDPK